MGKKQNCSNILKEYRQFETVGASKDCDNEKRKQLSLGQNIGNSNGWTEPFYFIQAADSQFGLIGRFIKKLNKPCWDEEMALSKEMIAKVNQMEPKPKFMVICGDLVDAFPGTKVRKMQVVDFKNIYAKLHRDIPLVCVCGNHDIGNEPFMSGIQEYKREFGDDYFYYTLNGVLFIVINSQFYQNRDYVENYAREHDKWLELILKKCKDFKYSIVFQHIPWFVNSFDEGNKRINIPQEVRLNWLQKFQEFGVTKIMCGHYHRNAGGWYGDIEVVVTAAIGGILGGDKIGIRVVKMLDKSVEHKYYPVEDIPSKIIL